MNRLLLFLVLLIGCFACCYAQSQVPLGLETISAQLIPFCDSNETGTTDNTTQATPADVCANPGETLKCKTLLDRSSNKEWIAVVHQKGILFYQVFNDSVKAIANYPSVCPELFVIGVIGDSIVISSGDDPICPALGLGTINLADLTSSNTSISENNTDLITLDVTPHIGLLYYMEWPLWSPETNTLVVFGASNQSDAADIDKKDLILRIVDDVDTPTILFESNLFPFNFDHFHTVLFTERSSASSNTTGEGSSLFIIGPTLSNLTQSSDDSEDSEEDVHGEADRIEIWDISFTNGSQPALVSFIPLKGAHLVAVHENGTALYVSIAHEEDRGNVTSGADDNSTDTSENGFLVIIDSSDPLVLTIAGNLTYEQMRSLAEQAGVTLSNDTDPATSVKQITAMKVAHGELMVGWNTGELFVFGIVDDPFNPNLNGYINVLKLDNFPDSPSSPGDEELNREYKGVSDICPWQILENQIWLTAFDRNKDGSLFIGLRQLA
jgi:hypothetical protein